MSDNLVERYRETIEKPPGDGKVLTTMDGSPVILNVQFDDNKAPFIYGRAFVSEILDDTLGWHLRSVNDDREIGWRCILMTKARREVVARCGDELESGKIKVKSLRIVRPSESGRSLLCEVAEYLP